MTPVQNSSPCCASHSLSSSRSDRLFHLLEKVSAIALGVFSAYASMELFLPFFLIGTAIGLYQYFYTPAADRLASHRASTCSQGLLEQLTGAKLPPMASLIANVAVTWCHIEHHTEIFVPVVGVSLGAWAGQKTGEAFHPAPITAHRC